MWCLDKASKFSSCRPDRLPTPTPLPRAENEQGRAGNRLTSTHGGGGCWGVAASRYLCTSVPLYLVRAAPRDREKSPAWMGGGPGDGTFPQSISTGARPTHLISIAPHLNPHSAHCPAPSASESPPSRVVDPDCCSPPLHVQRPGMGKSAPDRNRKHTKPWAPATACWFPPSSAHLPFCYLHIIPAAARIPDLRSACFCLTAPRPLQHPNISATQGHTTTAPQNRRKGESRDRG